MGDFLGDAVSVWLTFWLPDVFGFVFWEMKENWSLYRANRRPELSAVALGGDGETIRGLLQAGFHSGTIPKLYARLRQAERKARVTGSFGSVRACQAALAEVEKAVNLFVTREFCDLIAYTPIWQGPPPRVGAVALATNQIRVELRHVSYAELPMCLEFENRGGLLVAGVSVPGWFAHLPPMQQTVLHNALVVLFKFAGADRVREQPNVAFAAPEHAAALAVNDRHFGEVAITWQQCVACWQTDPSIATPSELLGQNTMWLLEPGKNGTNKPSREREQAEE
jgi:hypothetical protein